MIRAPFPAKYRQGLPYQWQPEELTKLALWSSAMWEDIAAAFPEVFKRAIEHMPSPMASPVYGERVSGSSDDGGPTPRYVIHGTEDQAWVGMRDEGDVIKNTRILVTALPQMASLIEAVWSAQRALDVADPSAVAKVLEEKPRAGAGECANPVCRHWCSGVSEDRLKGGRCPACATYRANHHGEERPHDLCHKTEVGGCALCQNAA